MSLSWNLEIEQAIIANLAQGLHNRRPVYIAIPGREVLVGLADAYTRELVTSALETDGYRVRTAASAQALRESVAKAPPGIVLLDADLAGPHLEECLRTGEEAARSVRVICIGGDQDRAADLGSHVLFINRPFLMSDLIRLVHNLANDHDTGEIQHPDRG